MKEFLELLRHRINALGDFMNRLQGVIGLKDSQDDSIHGKLNNLSTQINAIQTPKYYVEVLTVIDNYFLTTHEPLNGVCLNNEITIYHPDDGTLLWEGVTFTGNQGIISDAGNQFSGWKIKVQYFYL